MLTLSSYDEIININSIEANLVLLQYLYICLSFSI